MKRTLRYALLASAAALVLGMAAPSQAQQDNMAAPRAASQGAYQAADRYGARADTAREDASAAGGLEAYDYVPAQPGFNGDSCAMQGGYSQGTDYANCY